MPDALDIVVTDIGRSDFAETIWRKGDGFFAL
jgi:hypothetical protein